MCERDEEGVVENGKVRRMKGLGLWGILVEVTKMDACIATIL